VSIQASPARCLLRAPPHQHRRPGRGRGQPLAHRGVLPAGQGRGRAGPLPGPHLACLARPHHLVHARPGLARASRARAAKGEPAPATRAWSATR